MFQSTNIPATNTTSYKVVIPFYIYAAVSFLIATVLLFFSEETIAGHFFIPGNLSITHIMALGWGTMIIIGASHQLIPVLIEAPLYSMALAYTCFVLAALGIPLLTYGFYIFNVGLATQIGAVLICSALILYLLNIIMSVIRTKNENVHAYFIVTATVWLVSAALVGLLLLFNFTQVILPQNSLAYLPLHAHLGIVGWFLLLVIGVGSRLIPMFMISKFTNTKQLWWIYGLLNSGLLLYIVSFLYFNHAALTWVSASMVGLAVILFAQFCYKAYETRIRKSIDTQVQVSLMAVLMMLIPLICLLVILFFITNGNENTKLIIVYGFVIFFGWITSIILGMTFKTLPFIVWNKVYLKYAGKTKVPNPKDLFSEKLFQWMCCAYLPGFLLFASGIWMNAWLVLKIGALFLIAAAMLYNFNVIRLIMHKPKVHNGDHHKQ